MQASERVLSEMNANIAVTFRTVVCAAEGGYAIVNMLSFIPWGFYNASLIHRRGI